MTYPKCFWCDRLVSPPSSAPPAGSRDERCVCMNPECVAFLVTVTAKMLKQAQRIYDEVSKCSACGSEIGGICWECA
jgi:hypothetical protein